jgi:nifR3 family TIM-barrel protein
MVISVSTIGDAAGTPPGPTIGNLKLPHPYIQAALSGFSDLPMRRMSRRHGAAYAVNEMVLDRSVTFESDWQRRLLTVPEDDHPVGAQLMGADPETFAPAAERLVDAGYDVIDINFGCPVSHIMNKCRGGFLLSDPETAIGIVRSVVGAVGDRVPVTVKMRRGVDDTEAARDQFFRILDAAYHCGASAVTVHGRTVAQRYTGRADWSFLARIKDRVGDHIVFGSGDLFTPADCDNMMNRTGVDAVTIARGSLGNPWIFSNCLDASANKESPATPTCAEQKRVIEEHLEEIVNYYDDHAAPKVFARVALKYTQHHPTPRKLRAALTKAKRIAEFKELLASWYQRNL